MCDPTVEKPELLRDKFWEDVVPPHLPYTVGAQRYRQPEFRGSAELFLRVKDDDKLYAESPPAPREPSECRNRKHSGFALLKKENLYESIRSAWTQNRKLSASSVRRVESVNETMKDVLDYSDIEMKENYS